MSNENKKFMFNINQIFDNNNNNIQNLINYNNNDIDILKTKNENLEICIQKLRNEILNTINENTEFLGKKYDSILRLINKVN